MRELFLNWGNLLWSVVLIAGAAVLGLAAYRVLVSVARNLSRRTETVFDDMLVEHGRGPALLLIPLTAILIVMPALPLPEETIATLRRVANLGLIASLGWLAVASVGIAVILASARYQIDVSDNLEARRMLTRFHLLRRTAAIVIAFVTLSIMLMTFPSIRHLGVSMFASAGVAGIVIGLAARPTIANLIAGLQIAFTEPIRLDDVVIVEGEWGRIEEIRMTYVVVRIWDMRRLVVPISHFIESPFQNWTRVTADLLGTVFLYVDYTVPVEEVRRELHRILASSGMWDGSVWNLQVTNATEHTLELRALMSAPDSSTAWDLRCHVREKLIAFLRERYPESLPRARAEIRGFPPAPFPQAEERKPSFGS
jgi:small-conductance mechanosensitive channel